MFDFMKLKKMFLVFISAIFLVNCGGGGGNSVSNNIAPIANAGKDQAINKGDTVTLDASKSSDSDGKIVKYEWKRKDNTTISTKKKLIVTVPKKIQKIPIYLTVTDDDGATDTDMMFIVVTENKIVLQDNVTVISENNMTKIDSIIGSTKEGNITFNNSTFTKDWKENDIKILEPSDSLSQGMALKIKSIKSLNNGKSEIEYSVPTMDEVFKESKIKFRGKVTTNMIKKVKMNKYTKIDFSTINKKSNKMEKWFPNTPSLETEVTGLKDIRMRVNVPVYENNDTTTFGEKEFIDLNLEFKISDLFIDYSFENNINIINGKLPKLKNHIDIKYDMKQNINVEMGANVKANLADVLKDNTFKCGIVSNSTIGIGNVKIKSSGFEDSDICLGYMSLELSPVPVRMSLGNAKAPLVSVSPLALKLFIIMGADLKIKVVSKVELEKSSYIETGVHFDTTRPKNDIFKAYSREQKSKNNVNKSEWEYKIKGEMSGEAKIYGGIAFAPYVYNMNLFVLNATAGPELTGKSTVSYNISNPKGLSSCTDVNLELFAKFGAKTSNKIDVNITNKFVRKYINNELNATIEYKWEPLSYPTISLYNYNSCKDKDYKAEFIRLPSVNSDFALSNIRVRDKDRKIITPKDVLYIVYQNGNQIKSGSIDILDTLDNGDYTIQVILIIDWKEGIKTSLETEYRVKNASILTVNAGADQTVKFGEDVILNGTYNYNEGNSIITFKWLDESSSVISTNNRYIVKNLSVGEHTFTFMVNSSKENITKSDKVTITVEDKTSSTIIANAGADQTVKFGDGVIFDASKSTDSSGDILSYEWKENNIVLSTQKSFTHYGFSVGTHKIVLTVTNSNGEIASDSITVIVKEEVNQEIKVNSITPLSAIYEQETIFTVKGENLPDTLAMHIDNCKDMTLLSSGNFSSRQFSCIPSYATGMQQGVVKDKSGGTVLKTFSVNVTTNTEQNGVKKSDGFITTWKIEDNDKTITIPINPMNYYGYNYNYNYNIDWGDGNENTNVTTDITHTYSNSGIYTVTIYGVFPHFSSFNITNAKKLISIEQWGKIKWKNMSYAFAHCRNLIGNAKDTPDLSNVTRMTGMFYDATKFNQDIGDWDVSNVTNMAGMFQDATKFNQDIGDWDVSNVTNMAWMFQYAESFNQNIGNWNVSNVINMQGMFYDAISFNQNIGSWNVSNVTNMKWMFYYAISFSNQDLSSWDVSKVTQHNNFSDNWGEGNIEPNWK